MKLPFNGFIDFFRWVGTIIIMVPVAIIVVVAAIAVYAFIPFPSDGERWSNNYEDER